MVNFENLLYFITCEKYGSISAAAKNLNVTPSAISISLKNLEKELNLSLFERLPKGLKLTKEGLLLLDRAKDVLFSLEQFENTAKELQSNNAQALSDLKYLYFFSEPSVSDMLLDKISNRIYSKVPNIDLILCEDHFKTMIPSLAEERNSVTLIWIGDDFIQFIQEQYTNVIALDILQKRDVGILYNKNTRFLTQEQKNKPSLSLNELSNAKFIQQNWHSSSMFTFSKLFQSFSTQHNIYTTLAPNITALRTFLYNDIGIAFGIYFPYPKNDTFFEKIAFKPLDIGLTLSLCFLYNTALSENIYNAIYDIVYTVFEYNILL